VWNFQLLLEDDPRAWHNLAREIARLAEANRRRFRLTTLEADDLRDHVEDLLLDGNKRRLRNFRDPSALGSWVGKVMRHRVWKMLGRRHVALPLADTAARWEVLEHVRPSWGAATADSDVERPASQVVALHVLDLRNALTARQTLVIWLWHVERIPSRRIAAALCVSREAVRQANKRATKAIQRMMQARLACEESLGTEVPPPL